MSPNMNIMTFSEIISKNNDLNNKIKNENKIFIKILSNITLHQIKPIIEYSLNYNDIFCSVKIGEYDNIVKESLEISNEIPIIFWEISNLYDGFAFVDTFLINCRVLGRKIEHSFMQELIKFSYSKKRELKGLIFKYTPTTKNAPIKNFLDQTSVKYKKLENRDIEYFYDKNFKLNNKLHKIIWEKN